MPHMKYFNAVAEIKHAYKDVLKSFGKGNRFGHHVLED